MTDPKTIDCPECGHSPIWVRVELRGSTAPRSLDPLTLDHDDVTSNGSWEFEIECDECGWNELSSEDEVEWI